MDTVTGLLPGVTYTFSIKAYSTDITNNKVFSQTAIDQPETTSKSYSIPQAMNFVSNVLSKLKT